MMDGILPARRKANYNQTPEERLRYEPAAQRAETGLPILKQLLFFKFSHLFSCSSLLSSLVNQLTELDNPAFLFSPKFSFFSSSPFLIFCFSVGHF